MFHRINPKKRKVVFTDGYDNFCIHAESRFLSIAEKGPMIIMDPPEKGKGHFLLQGVDTTADILDSDFGRPAALDLSTGFMYSIIHAPTETGTHTELTFMRKVEPTILDQIKTRLKNRLMVLKDVNLNKNTISEMLG